MKSKPKPEPENTVVVLDAVKLAAFQRVVMLAQSRLADRTCDEKERCRSCADDRASVRVAAAVLSRSVMVTR